MRRDPSHASAAALSKGIPKPTLRVVRLVTNGSVTRASNCSSIPRPLSCILAFSRSLCRSSSIVISMVLAPAATLFSAISSKCRDISLNPTHLRTILVAVALARVDDLRHLVSDHAPTHCIIDYYDWGLATRPQAATNLKTYLAVFRRLPDIDP